MGQSDSLTVQQCSQRPPGERSQRSQLSSVPSFNRAGIARAGRSSALRVALRVARHDWRGEASRTCGRCALSRRAGRAILTQNGAVKRSPNGNKSSSRKSCPFVAVWQSALAVGLSAEAWSVEGMTLTAGLGPGTEDIASLQSYRSRLPNAATRFKSWH